MYIGKWSDLTPTRKIAVAVLSIVQLGLLVAALFDLRRRTPAELNGSRRLWTGLAFINFVGPIAYFTIGRKRHPVA